jgi:hypothetical protein
MAILGINAVWDRSAACSISSSLSISAICDKHNRAFPLSAVDSLRNSHDDWDSYVTHQHAANEVRQAMPRGVSLEVVDYCEAISMATICSTDWTSCAILLSDSYYTKLGYYKDGSFYWIREFTYPNNLALFSAAVTRFLGYDPLDSEDSARALSMTGNSLYTDWITTNAVAISDGSYQLLHNLERGFGVATRDANIAASAQLVLSSILVNLSAWLRRNIDIDKLAIVGRSASNYISNSAISELSGYKEIAAISLNGAASTALGAAALITRPLLEHHYIGCPTVTDYTADELASKLLNGDIVNFYDKTEFSDNAFLSNNQLMLPFAPLLHNLNTNIVYAVCQDRDYHSYFEGKHIPYYGQYISTVKNKKALQYDSARVITVAKNKNPLINRVLEITRAQGYPIIVSTPI